MAGHASQVLRERSSPFRRLAVLAVLVLAACGAVPATGPAGSGSVAPSGPAASPTTRPDPGHEVFGFVPYWEMDDSIAEHVRGTALTTLALFSVTTNARGALNTGQRGYRAITGEVGRRLARDARDRGVRVELVFTSFGLERNRRFFADPARQDATIAAVTGLVDELGLDGVNVDVESLDPLLLPAYGDFVDRFRAAVVAADPSDALSVATGAGANGAAMAAAASAAGADRIFLMGYDYHVPGSSPGASAPLASRDGAARDLPWSLDLYAALGVPRERTILGLPLYGVEWPVAGPVIGAPETGRGETWIPRRNFALLQDPAAVPLRDDIEIVEVYLLASDGSIGPPSTDGAPPPGNEPPQELAWRAVYVDSPATLAPKLALANERGLLGAGFWAIGYERGLPGYDDLIARFAAGQALDQQAE